MFASVGYRPVGLLKDVLSGASAFFWRTGQGLAATTLKPVTFPSASHAARACRAAEPSSSGKLDVNCCNPSRLITDESQSRQSD